MNIQHLPSDPARLERLKGDIDSARKKISAFPPCKSSDDNRVRCKLIKDLAEKINEHELLLEEDRVASVTRNHEELHPPDMEECPICLESVQNHSMTRFMCCGGSYCGECNEQQKMKGLLTSCPLCRADFPKCGEVEKMRDLTTKCAERKVPWAQFELGLYFEKGTHGCPANIHEALKWYKLAAQQRYPQAIYAIGRIYETGHGNDVVKSFDKAFPLIKDATDMGYDVAHVMLAMMHIKGEGVSKDESKAAHYLTLSYSQGQQTKIKSGMMLGDFFLRGKGD